MTLQHLLVPVDFSKNSLKAIDAALGLAKPVGGQITLLYVLEPIIIPYGETLPGDLPNDVDRRAGVDAEMERLRGAYPADAPIDALVVDGTAWDAICDAAERKKCDLIVITSHGYTGLKRLFLGSTAERIVRHAKCPVLVLKSFAEKVWRRPLGARPPGSAAVSLRLDPPARPTSPTHQPDPPARPTSPTHQPDPPARPTSPTHQPDPPAHRRTSATREHVDSPARRTSMSSRRVPERSGDRRRQTAALPGGGAPRVAPPRPTSIDQRSSISGPRLPLALRATPNAARSEFAGWSVDAQGRPVLRVKLQAPPAEGRANDELLRFLSEKLGCPRSGLTLRRGATGRHKIVEIPAAAWERLPPRES